MNDALSSNGPQDGQHAEVGAEVAGGEAAHPDSTPSPGDPQAPFPGSPPQAEAPGAEAIVWVGRTSWKHFAGSISLWFVGTVLLAWLMGSWASGSESLSGSVAFWIAAVPIVLSGLFVLGRVLIRVYGTRYRLTTERLFIERGILSQVIDQTELIRVDDVRVCKSAMDRVFGLGTVEVMSTDMSDRSLTVVGISGCDWVAESIREAVRSLRKKSVFVESL
ncbi:MAG: PH domain-containing protein [Phycisphaerae bacterium]